LPLIGYTSAPPWRARGPRPWDLLIRAKHLFIAAILAGCPENSGCIRPIWGLQNRWSAITVQKRKVENCLPSTGVESP
jgi:hypothetical protein